MSDFCSKYHQKKIKSLKIKKNLAISEHKAISVEKYLLVYHLKTLKVSLEDMRGFMVLTMCRCFKLSK